MILRTRALFHTTLPEDLTDYRDGNVQFGSRNVAEAIADILGERGYQVTKPEYEGDHGWTFEVRQKNQFVWFQITSLDADRCLLIGEQFGSFGITRNPKTVFHAEVLTELNVGLSSDARFYDVSWYLDEELFAGFPGEAAPVSADGGGAEAQPEPIFKGGFVQRLMDLILSRRKLVEVRPWAEFRADLTPEAAPYAGRETVSAIGVLLEKPDCSVAGPFLMKNKSWRLVARVRGEEVSLYVTALADRRFRLFCEPPPWVRRRFSDDYETYVRVVAHVHTALQGDPRFHDIRWSTLPGGDPGTDGPMDLTPSPLAGEGGARGEATGG
jgi:hypothetical protein